jgi:hypothetical protein
MFSPMSLSPTRSFSESIEAEIAGAGQKAIVYNDNRIDNRRIFNPVVGVNREDLGMGPVVPRDLE